MMHPNYAAKFNTNSNFLPNRDFYGQSLHGNKDKYHLHETRIPPLMNLQAVQPGRALIKKENQSQFSYNQATTSHRTEPKPLINSYTNQEVFRTTCHQNYQYQEPTKTHSAHENVLSPLLVTRMPPSKTCLPFKQKEHQIESQQLWNNEASSSKVGPVQNKTIKLSSSTQVRGNPPTTSVNSTMTNAELTVSNKLLLEVCGTTQIEKMFIFTGTVERVIKWNKIFCNHFCHYEVIGFVISIQEGNISQQKIMLLRDKKGPVLQLIYYETTHIDIEDFYVGKILRCVGKMIGPNIMNAFTIRSARETEVEILERLCLICDQAISYYLKV